MWCCFFSIFYCSECHFNNYLYRAIYFAFLEVEKSLGVTSWNRMVWVSKMGQGKSTNTFLSISRFIRIFLSLVVYSNLTVSLHLFYRYKVNYFTVYIFKYILWAQCMLQIIISPSYLFFSSFSSSSSSQSFLSVFFRNTACSQYLNTFFMDDLHCIS